MLRVDRRAGGIGGGSGCNTMPPKPLGGDFIFPPLFVGLPSLRGDALFGGPFSSWQVTTSSTSPTSDADEAAPDVDVPPPFALSGASPFLHARHKEQRFLFLFESFEWLHRWHGHDESRRVSDSRRRCIPPHCGYFTDATRRRDLLTRTAAGCREGRVGNRGGFAQCDI
jgi:hypothetical protein